VFCVLGEHGREHARDNVSKLGVQAGTGQALSLALTEEFLPCFYDAPNLGRDVSPLKSERQTARPKSPGFMVSYRRLLCGADHVDDVLI